MKLTILLIISFFWVSATQAQFAGGDGSEADPYQVETLEQLQEAATYRDQYFIQTADIDAADTQNWNDGAGFEPLGEQDNPFTGSFDGNGFVIENLHVNREEEKDASLFGFIGDGVMENLNLENVTIVGGNRTGAIVGRLDGGVIRDSYATGVVTGAARTGGIVGVMTGGNVENSVSGCEVHGARNVGGIAGTNNGGLHVTGSHAYGDINGERDVGGLVGDNSGLVSQSHAIGNVFVLSGDGHDTGGLIGVNEGEIEDSYATGDVEAIGKRAGGLVGQNDGDGTITNSYATGSVTVDEMAGGLVGANREGGKITTSYSAGGVTSSQEVDFGGFVGLNEAVDAIIDGYWDTESSDMATGVGTGDEDGVIGLATGQMTGFQAEDNMAGFDFVGTWQITEDYPALYWEDVEALEPVVFAGGDGSEADPYQIETLDQLQAVADYPDQYFIQTADIDASATENWNDSEGFMPIGGSGEFFEGTFDGDNFKIENLRIYRSEADHAVGLFGTVTGVVENVTLEEIVVEGSDHTGGLAGVLTGGKIINSSTSGMVSGSRPTGGLVGQNDPGEIIGSHSTAEVAGSRDVGGLVGECQEGGIVIDSYATGDVSTTHGKGHDVGGLVGANKGGEIYGSYAAGNVSGIPENKRAGGLVGQHMSDGAIIENSYATGTVTGGELFAGGLVGRSRHEVTIVNSYSTGQASLISEDADEGTVAGFAGVNADGSEIIDSYWDSESSGHTVGANEVDEGLTGLTTAEMTGTAAEDNMAGFDFVETWQITDNYPILGWEESPVSAEEEMQEIVSEITLKQNYPNPFNPSTKISFAIPEQAHIRLTVYNILGEQVVTLINETRNAGWYAATFDASNLSSGIYIYRLEAGGFVETRKMLFVK